MAETKSRIFIIDDHPLVREWLTTLLNQQPDMIVSGEAEDAAQALSGIAAAAPDVAIVDLSLGGGTGVDLIKAIKLRYPTLSTIVLSMHDERLYAERVIRAGARGYIMKRETSKKIVAAIHQVLEGKLSVSDRMAASFLEKFADGQPAPGSSPIANLSDRELEVFDLLGQGYETRQVADTLHVSIKTVQTYCARIKDKLKLASAAELFREALLWKEGQSGN
jgi:DNA-binding NarL/FixJ family response regulator